MPPVTKKYYEVGVLSKACLILEMLSTRKSWELAALSKAVGLPKTTVHRIILTLEDSGYVIQEKQGGEYCLSFKMFSVGSKMLQYSCIVDVSRPYCMELREAVNETVNLCVPFGTDMLVVDRHISTQPLRQDTVIGGTFPMLQSASGKIFLAFAHESEVVKTITQVQEKTGREFVDNLMPSLREELEEVRKSGLAYDAEEVFKGVRCIAVPLLDVQNCLAGTLSVSVPTVRLNKKTIAHIKQNIMETSQKISLRLGASPANLPF